MSDNQNLGSVSVTSFPGGQEAVVLEGGDTVASVVERADFSTSGFQITVNAQPATADTAVRNGDRIVLTRQVKGN